MIDLSAIPLDDAQPEEQDFGGLLVPALGAAVQRLDRTGNRWALAFTTPNLPAEPDLRIWASRVARGKKEGILIWIPEPDLPARNYGVPRIGVSALAGSAIRLAGLTPGVTIVEGKWLSVIHDGRRYLYNVAADAVAAADGTASVRVSPMLRVPVTAGDVVELTVAKMQGHVADRFRWTIPLARFAPLAFTVGEDE